MKALPTLADPLKELRVGLVLSQFSAPKEARGRRLRYAAIRLTHTHGRATELISIPAEYAVELALSHGVPEPDLITAGKNWAAWPVGLQTSGLDKFALAS